MSRVRVWDLPVRLFHWLLAVCVTGSFVSAKIGGNAMVWHERFGLATLALLLFRILWGFWGSHHARFASFVRGPSVVMATIRMMRRNSLDRPMPAPLGHSPVAAVSVLAFLFFFSAQAVLGLMASDDIAFDGPWVKYVSSGVVDWATRLHKLNQWVLLGLIALHLSAIAYFRMAWRQNLVGPMISGDQKAEVIATASRDDATLRVRAVLIFAVTALAVAYLSR